MWGLTPFDHMKCRQMFKESRYEGSLTPVGLGRPTIFDPGYSGGMNWGSVSINVDRGILIANWMRLPSRVELMPRSEAAARGLTRFDGSTGQGSGRHPQDNTPYAANAAAFLSPMGMPCTAPPWGLLTAVDLVSGRVIWSQPIGTGRDSGPFGIESHLPITMGVPMSGGVHHDSKWSGIHRRDRRTYVPRFRCHNGRGVVASETSGCRRCNSDVIPVASQLATVCRHCRGRQAGNGESLEHEDRCVRVARVNALRFDVPQPAALHHKTS